jgi:tRNA-dihydrouridine synthase B
MKQIRNLKLKSPYFLAPMEKVNDIAFRILCKKAGAGLTYTGMINPLTKQKFSLDDKPALQLFTNNEKGIKEFIKKYQSRVVLFDFNLGCPAELARKCKIGAFMHKDLEMIEKILKIMRKSTNKPISIKIRKSKEAEKIVKIVEKYCDAIAIHPRTQEQGYSGKPDIEFAKKIKKMTKLPIIYSGDVNQDNSKELLKYFDYLMIGRQAMGNPNIFAKLTNSKVNISFNDYLKLAKKYKIEFPQIKFQAINFTKGREGASKLREKLMKAKSLREIEKVMN